MANTTSYWKKRQDEMMAGLDKRDDKFTNQLIKEYDRIQNELSKEIAYWYQNYGTIEIMTYRSAMKKLSPEEQEAAFRDFDNFIKDKPQYANLLPVRNKIYELNRMEAMQLSVRIKMAELGAIEDEQMTKYLEKSYKFGYESTMKNLQNKGALYSFNNRQLELALSDKWFNDKNYSDRIWDNKNTLRNWLTSDLATGLQQGVSYDKMMKQLQQRMDVGKFYAKRLVWTESAFFLNTANANAFKADGIKEYQYIAILDDRTSDTCKSLNEEVFSFDDYKPGVNAPPMHSFCRSTIIPLENSKKKLVENAETVYNEDEYNFKEIFENNGMKKAVGEENFNKFIEHLSNNPNENVRKLFGKYGDQITFSKLRNFGRNFARANDVNLTQEAFDGRRISNPFQIVYHEIGHAIDFVGVKHFYGEEEVLSNHFMTKKIFGKKHTWQTRLQFISDDPKYNLGETITRDLWEWANGKGCLTQADLGHKPRKKAEKDEWYAKQEEVYKNYGRIKDKINALKDEAKANPHLWSNISDIIEGTKIIPEDYVFGSGHGKSYWTDGTTQTTEFFAEITDSLSANPEEYENIKKMFPEAIKIYDKIIKDLLKG